MRDAPMNGHLRACGIETVVYRGDDIAELCNEAAAIADEREHTLLVAMFDPTFDADELALALKRRVAVPTQICCSTAGNISPFGYIDGGAVLVLFPAESFEALAAVVPDISSEGLDRGARIAADLLSSFEHHVAHRRGASSAEGGPFALTFIDGLSNHEEVTVAAFHRALPAIPLVGGSAGDGLSFRSTRVCHEGRAHADAAVLCLVWSRVPFRLFKSEHYRPSDTRLVVTACDAERRLVTELNGVDAALEYANVLGLDPQSLTPFSFASHPVAVRVGGEHYCRSIRRMEPEGLSFFCAIENGVVLTIAEGRDMIGTMRETLDLVAEEMGGIDLVIGFDCILRRIEAEERQMSRQVAEVFRDYNVLGFTTYGEQYMSMHLNQTLTGIAFGRSTTSGAELSA